MDALVVAPLSSIIKDQVETLQDKGFTAADISKLSECEMRECSLSFLFVSAEEVLKPKFQAELRNPESNLHKRLCCFVVDESHTIESWTGKR